MRAIACLSHYIVTQYTCCAQRLTALELTTATLHASIGKTTTEAPQLVPPVFQYLYRYCQAGAEERAKSNSLEHQVSYPIAGSKAESTYNEERHDCASVNKSAVDWTKGLLTSHANREVSWGCGCLLLVRSFSKPRLHGEDDGHPAANQYQV